MKRITKLAAACAAVALVASAAAVVLAFHAPAAELTAADVLVLRPNSAARPAAHARKTVAWCGTDATAEDRAPDAVSSFQIHVIYAFPSDGADRFSTMASAIATDVAAMDAWWRLQDAGRTLRFDLFAFPGCAPGAGQLDLSHVRLSQPASSYAASAGRLAKIGIELGTTFADPFKKYLVYYDGPADDPRLCGESVRAASTGGRFAYSIVYAQSCRSDIGTGGLTASVAVHELAHNLGGVPAGGPPHGCPGDDAHVCENENDLLFPFTRGQGISENAIDVGRDDYYGHSGGWFDLQDSPWLSHVDAPQLGLTVAFTGSTGTGTVASLAPGIACPPACSISWDQGTQVALSAEPADGSRFVDWSGACTADPCTVTMSAAQSVVARFAAQVNLSIVVKHASKRNGTVRSRPAGIACPGTCEATFDKGTRIQLVATPARNAVLTGWGGACSGKSACSVALSSTAAVSATFGPRPPLCKPGQRSTRTRPCHK